MQHPCVWDTRAHRVLSPFHRPMLVDRRAIARLACILMMLATGHPLASQQRPVTGQSPADRADSRGVPADTAPEGAGPILGVTRGPLLDRPISRTEYPLGPGDVLTLAILGYTSHIVQITVTPEGTVVIPNVGVVRVGGLNLEQAEQLIARTTRRFYTDADVSVSLAAVRSFKIFVVGDVEAPGVRNVSAVTRVSEVVSALNREGIPRRNVLVRRAGGDTMRIDLARFLQTGDLTGNPTLREGDVVQVPRVDATVTVSGEFSYPGTYEFVPGESIADLIRIANGGSGFPSAAADTLRLMRFTGGSRGVIETMPRADAVGAPGMQLPVQPFDALFVPRVVHYGMSTTARIDGEVLRPGTYPIQPNVTTVRDLVEMAGGFTAEASLVDAVLRRNPVALPRDSLRLLENVPPELLTRDERRILQVTNVADDRNVVIDFPQLFAENGAVYDLPLQEDDYLFVPERRDQVTVLGAVVQPGIVGYEAGQSVEYFVQMAGGYSRRADVRDMVVIRARLGSRLSSEDINFVEPGDRIVVPFKEPLTFLERVQMTQGVISTISGIVLAVVGLQRLWN